MIGPLDLFLYGTAFAMFAGAVVLVAWIVWNTIQGVKAMRNDPPQRVRPYMAIRRERL